MGNPTFSEVTTAIRTLMGLVFLTAAAGKMRHWSEFLGVVANYRLLPDPLIAPVAYGLPPVEAILGTLLFFRLLSPWPEVLGAALLIVFAAAMSINLLKGRSHIDCGCFQGALKQPLNWRFVLRNGVLALLLGIAPFLTRADSDPWATVDGLLVGGVLFLILQSLNILWSIVPAWRRTLRANSGVDP